MSFWKKKIETENVPRCANPSNEFCHKCIEPHCSAHRHNLDSKTSPLVHPFPTCRPDCDGGFPENIIDTTNGKVHDISPICREHCWRNPDKSYNNTVSDMGDGVKVIFTAFGESFVNIGRRKRG